MKESLKASAQWLAVAAALALVLSICVLPRAAHASTPIDLDREGSVSLVMQDPDTLDAVPGGAMTLYRVADVQVEHGADYSFLLAADFADSGESLESLDAATASRLASYAQQHGIAGTERAIGENGSVTFDGLAPGLFLLVQQQPAEGYYAVAPFLASIPFEQNGALSYDVNATPKMELLDRAPSGPGEPDEPAASAKTGDDLPVAPLLALVATASVAIIALLAVRLRRR